MTRDEALEVLHETIASAGLDPGAPLLVKALEALQVVTAVDPLIVGVLRSVEAWATGTALEYRAHFHPEARALADAFDAWQRGGRPGVVNERFAAGTPCRVGNPDARYGERLHCIRDVGHDGEPHIDQRGGKWDCGRPMREAARAVEYVTQAQFAALREAVCIASIVIQTAGIISDEGAQQMTTALVRAQKP